LKLKGQSLGMQGGLNVVDPSVGRLFLTFHGRCDTLNLRNFVENSVAISRV
jgi:hypothetical protein